MTDVFISYSRKDGDFMRYLHGKLKEKERDVWVDWEDIPATADWWDEIKAAIEAADAFAFIISSHSVRSEVCRDEIQHAIDNNKRFIPLLYQEISDEDAPHVHPAIRSHNWIPFSDNTQYDLSIQKLIDALSTDPDYLRRHTRLLVRAKDWVQHERIASYLLKGEELGEYQKWLQESQIRQPKPTELQLEYILASQSARSRNQLRFAGGAIAAVIVFAAMIAFLLLQNQQIEDQQAQGTIIAQEQLATSQAQSTQLAAQATNIANIRGDSQNLIVQANLQNTQGALQTENGSLRETISALETANPILAISPSPTSEATEADDAGIEPEEVTNTDNGSGLRPTSEATITQLANPTGTAVVGVLATATEAAAEAQGLDETATALAPSPPSLHTAEVGPPILPTQPNQENAGPGLGDFYVNPVGNDSNSCLNPREACQTINGAIAKAFDEAIIEIGPGVYTEILLIEHDIVLLGMNPESTIINGDFVDTVITVQRDVSVALLDLTITGGNAVYGGGIRNYGELYLENVSVIGNFANLTGGAIANFAYIEAIELVLLENYAPRLGEIYTASTALTYVDDEELPLFIPVTGLGIDVLAEINTTDGDRLNMRGDAGLNTRTQITPLSAGTPAIVIDGPITVDGLRWWKILLETGASGWVTDNVDGIETLLPLE